jgi:7,8-dihydropterin-6-yl-methyl-4-(beta-D-ribofuranosyl)aminobenzene 5'-phosphate synthase
MTKVTQSLIPIDTLTVDVITDDVSDAYVSKTLFAVSEFSNIVRAGAKVISGEALLCANLGFGSRLISNAGDIRQYGDRRSHFHTQLLEPRNPARRC